MAETAETLTRTGHEKKARGDMEGALAAYRAALVLEPESSAAQNNIGLALRAVGRPDEAARHLQKAAAAFPETPPLFYNLGNALADARRPGEAAAAFERALELDPNHFRARVHLAFARLTLGQYREGFAAYEARFSAPGFPPPVCPPQGPLWTGDNLGGGRILLIAEQGFGDVIQFIRYAPMVKARGGTVTAACPPQLAGLLQGQPGIDEVLPRPDPNAPVEAAFDAYACLMSLPHIFGTTPETIPAAVPYLRVPPESAQRAASWGVTGPGLKAGLVRRAGAMSPTGAQRSLPPEALPGLLNTPGVRWFGLDARISGDERPDAPTDARPDAGPDAGLGAGGVDLGPHIEPFADAAAAAASMDVIVTADTAMAHLAGALGKPVFVLLPYAPDWRWGLEGETSPWYPSARLFRQQAPGDWSAPVAACSAALQKTAGGGMTV